MQQQGIFLSKRHACCLLQDCTKRQDLEGIKRLYCLMTYSGLDSISSLADQLIRVYASWGSLVEAVQAFNKVANPTEYTWTAIISAYTRLGQGQVAFQLYDRMVSSCVEADKCVYLAILKTCTITSTIQQGRFIHSQIIGSVFQFDEVLSSAVIDMYTKCGSLEEAHNIFNRSLNPTMMCSNAMITGYAKCGNLDEAHILLTKLSVRDVVSWNSIISAYAQYGKGFLALECSEYMRYEGIKPDKITFSSILKACGLVKFIERGRYVHEEIIECGLQYDVFIGNTLVDMYAKCDSLKEAHDIFIRLPIQDVVSWNAIISAHAQHGKALLAIIYYGKMQLEGIKPDKVTFLNTLKACGSIGAIEQGRHIHERMFATCLHVDVVTGSTLIDMYTRCGDLEEACKTFLNLPKHDLVSWNAIMAGCAQHGESHLVLEYFNKMHCEDIRPDKVTFLSILKACGNIGGLEQGRCVHEQSIQFGLQHDTLMGSSLVDMYAKCSSMDEACKVFDKMENRNVVIWSVMIAGYIQDSNCLLAIEYFGRMQDENTKPNQITFLSILKACGSIGAIGQGRYIHDWILGTECKLEIIVGNTLIDMYANYGSMDEARIAFHRLENQDLFSWSSIISGYAQVGNVRSAVECLEGMCDSGIHPNDVAFTGILTACSHAGLVEEGYRYFRSMQSRHGIMPNLFHYNCVVDLLGRGGYFKEAKHLLQTLKEPNICGWTTLLSACRMHGNMHLARRCFHELIGLDASQAPGYVLMSNLCSEDDGNQVERTILHRNACKELGITCIELNNKVPRVCA